MKKWMMAVAMLVTLAALPAHAQTYWRLEAGYSKANDAGFKDKDWEQSGFICGDMFCNGPDTLDNVGESSVLGLGIGYRYDRNVRADVTLAYRGGYRLDDTEGGGAIYRATLRSTALMVNGYYDFTAGNVSPYVGLGIGWAQNKLGTLTQGFPNTTFHNTVSGGTKNNTAFAVMFGVGIPVAGRTLDLGYRWVDLGKFETGTTYSNDFFPSFTISGAGGRLTAHEVTIGVRF